jgi:SAM-dependent methyltransferase
LKAWKNEIGIAYTKRNDVDIEERNICTVPFINQTLSESFALLFDGFADINRILEVGSGLGYNLNILSRLGSYELYGVEPQRYAIFRGKEKFSEYTFIDANIFDLPFKDDSFDLVFTRMVLIHIHPDDLKAAMQEILRVSNHYIAALEYHSETIETAPWRSHEGLLWKQDFEKAYLRFCPEAVHLKSYTLEVNEEAYGKKGLYYKHFLLGKTHDENSLPLVQRDI